MAGRQTFLAFTAIVALTTAVAARATEPLHSAIIQSLPCPAIINGGQIELSVRVFVVDKGTFIEVTQ